MSEEKTQVQNARKDLDILNKMKNLPGGLVIIPLVIAVVLATFVPQVFQIGGYVTALFYEGNIMHLQITHFLRKGSRSNRMEKAKHMNGNILNAR